MPFTKHDYAKKKCKRLSSGSFKSVKPVNQKKWSEEKMKNMYSRLKEYEKKSGKQVGWTHILPQEVNSSTAACTSQIDVGSTKSQCVAGHDFELLSPIKDHSISLNELAKRCEQVKKKILVAEKEIENIEKSTRGQSSESQWFLHRKIRITASKCHRVASLRDSTSPTKTMREILHYNDKYQSQNMKEGLMKEDEILKEYLSLKHNQGHANLTVEKCGFFVSGMFFLRHVF